MNYINLPNRFLSWMMPVKSIAPLVMAGVMGATAAGGSALGRAGRDKERIKRIEPPELKFANAIRMMEAARLMTGKQNYVDELEDNRLRSLASQERQHGISAILRGYGQGGTEGPGRFEAINNLGTAGIQSVINAMSTRQIEGRGRAMSIANNLARDNPPYNKRRVKEGSTAAKIGGDAISGFSKGLGATKAPMSSPLPQMPGVQREGAFKGYGLQHKKTLKPLDFSQFALR